MYNVRMSIAKGFLQKCSQLISKDSEVIDMTIPSLNPLAEMIPNHKVRMNLRPYRYTIIDDFFTDEYYQKLCSEYERFLALGLAEEDDQYRFSRFSSYDAYGFTPNPREESAISIFRTQAWRQYFSDLFSIDFTDDEVMALHHHLPSSKDGWVHNDYSLCSFSDDYLQNGINPWYHQCTYEDSDPFKQPNTRKVMRSVTLIYYLNNDCDGKYGGETGLFSDEHTLAEKVAPKNNRLMAFEVSPHSFHAFQANTKYPRSTITQWFHADPQETFKRFNNSNFIPW